MRFRWILLGCTLTSLAAIRPSHADDTLTLDLPPSQAAVEQRAADRERQKQATIAAAQALTRQQLTRQPRSSGSTLNGFSMPSRSGGRQDRVVGRLGELSGVTSIYRSRSARSGKLTTAPKGTYVAIEDDEGDWYGVLMADNSIGWLPKSAVNMMDYQVVSSNTQTIPSFGSDSYARTPGAFFQGDVQQLIHEAYRYLGVPYHWGGNTFSGLDCSGFMKNIFATCGFRMPRTAAEQVSLGTPVTPDQLQPGDRIYFGHPNISHTGMYLGNGYFIHASSAHHQVVISQLSESFYTRIFNCARR